MAEMTSTNPSNVKVEMGAFGLPKHAKLAHAFAIVIAGVVAVAVSVVLADGASVIKLKDPSQLPRATNISLKALYGIDYRLDELLGETYGIGLHHDQSGRSWTRLVKDGSTVPELIRNLGLPVIAAAIPSVVMTDGLKHPVPLLECDDLQTAGLAAMSLGFIADAVAIVMIIFHVGALAGLVPANLAKMGANLVWLTLSLGFLVVICLACGIYTATWTCNQPIIPTLKLNDHFDLQYGFTFALIGYASCVLTFCVSLTMMDATPGSPVKAVGGTVFGLVIAIAAAFITLGANDAWTTNGTWWITDPLYNHAPTNGQTDANPCQDQKPYSLAPLDNYFVNQPCFKDSVRMTLEQSGANVTFGYKGLINSGDRVPITVPYSQTDLCPVNVHWHLGAEHLSVGEYDTTGGGPAGDGGSSHAGDGSSRRELADSDVRLGHRCKLYDATNNLFTTPYTFNYCDNTMLVGETYEVHWPHSAAGACGTKYQYQYPFYDGVFCNAGVIRVAPLNTYQKIGVQGQVFILVNDGLDAASPYHKADLFNGMHVDAANGWGSDMSIYTGSTTGTSRDNSICSRYTPITWQVDRKCHMVSAYSFDMMCKAMMEQADDMSGDLYAHGARTTTWSNLTADNYVFTSHGRK